MILHATESRDPSLQSTVLRTSTRIIKLLWIACFNILINHDDHLTPNCGDRGNEFANEEVSDLDPLFRFFKNTWQEI